MIVNFLIRPQSENCRRVSDFSDHCLVGLSPFNSYYTPSRVEALVQWAAGNFTRVDVLVPGFEAAHTLTAAGVRPLEAVGRVRRAVNQLRNPAVLALSHAGVSAPERHVHTWTQLMSRPAYAALREQARAAYRVDPVLRAACRAVAREAVRSTSDTEPGEEQIDACVSYPIAELPLIVDSPSIFDVASSVFVYHRRIALAAAVLAGPATGLRSAAQQGFVVAEPVPPGGSE
ncbi:tRNA-dependent cyclodipeptide synthase [Streptomyces sp. NPDC048680]|uniref:tRNA-dependent cyclodipeptide synthase n=1 Tax=Streptomyces sp. NPDC048680 TaxID=3155492 RepID=UPI003421328E